MKSRLERREAEWKRRSPFMYPTKVLGIRVSRCCIIEKKKGVPNSLDLESIEKGREAQIVVGAVDSQERSATQPVTAV